MLNKKEILLLDDNEVANYYNQDIVEDTLLFDITTVFMNPQLALEEIIKRIDKGIDLPGFFLVDIQMPEMTGFEFLQQLEPYFEKLEEKPKIYILTTSSHKRDQEQYVNSKLAGHYLNKPLTVDMLLEQFYSDK